MTESPLAKPLPWNLVSEAYDTHVLPFFSQYSADALRLANVVPGERVLDVATGPGTLAVQAARAGAKVTAIDFAEEMIAKLRPRIGSLPIDAHVGDGMALPFPDASFDAAFSMFGLMFFPDRAKGFSELHRALAAEGRAVVATWQPFHDPVLDAIFGAIGEAMNMPHRDNPLPLSNGDDLVREMREAGFREVTLRAITHHDEDTSLRAYWTRVARSAAPIVILRTKLGEDAWRALDERVYESARAKVPEGPVRIPMTANVAVGLR